MTIVTLFPLLTCQFVFQEAEGSGTPFSEGDEDEDEDEKTNKYVEIPLHYYCLFIALHIQCLHSKNDDLPTGIAWIAVLITMYLLIGLLMTFRIVWHMLDLTEMNIIRVRYFGSLWANVPYCHNSQVLVWFSIDIFSTTQYGQAYSDQLHVEGGISKIQPFLHLQIHHIMLITMHLLIGLLVNFSS
ncbi:hypothetical protein ACJX0J_009143 [Zea mays]